LSDLHAAIQAAIEARIPGADARARRSVLGELARVLAGASRGLHLYAENRALQMLPITADIDGLRLHGQVWGVPERTAAYAAGLVTFSGLSGAVIPSGTKVRSAAGVEYLTDAPIALIAGAASVPVVAETAGVAGNLAAAATLELVSPVSGVNTACAVGAGGITGGSDPESTEAYRARILARIQAPPAGGSLADYEAWALAVPNVTRVWVRGSGGAGVTVLVMMDGVSPNAAPTADALAPVAAAIAPKRPVTADVFVRGPALKAVDFTLAIAPDTAATRAAVETALAQAILAETLPGAPLLISRLRAALSAAAGVTDYVMTSPAANVTLAADEIAGLGVIAYGVMP
jgi:uncharacterized phage protein gp47/JayE